MFFHGDDLGVAARDDEGKERELWVRFFGEPVGIDVGF